MTDSLSRLLGSLIAIGLLSWGTGVRGAEPKSGAVSSQPLSTTASFGDWTVRCVRQSETAPKSCEVQEALTLNGQTAPTAVIAFGNANGKMMLTVVVPVNVSFARPPSLMAGATVLSVTYRRCMPVGCFADAPIDSAALKTLGMQTQPGRLRFTDAGDREIDLPISYRGLSQALANLATEVAAH